MWVACKGCKKSRVLCFYFFFNDTATTEIYTLSLHDALPICLSSDQLTDMKAVSAVLPFRVNDYVIEQLIDPGSIPNDPIFQLTFPQRGMLEEDDFRRMRDLVAKGASEAGSEENTSELQSRRNSVCRLRLDKKKTT